MNKKYLFVFILLGFLFFPYKSFAISKIVTYTSSYSVVNQCNSSTCSWSSPSLAAKRIRIYDTITHTANTTLTYSLIFDTISTYEDLTASNCGLFWEAGDTFGGSNNFVRTYNGRFSSTKYLMTTQFTNVRSFASTNTTNVFVECEMNVSSLVYQVAAESSTTTSTNTASNSEIIANDNQNTQMIINNNNQTSQAIINSQNETTDAIEDLNDTLQDTTISDETIGDKVGDIDSISETPITDLITMPIVLLTKITTASADSCTPYVLPFKLWGNSSYSISLPCFNGALYLGSVWSVIDAFLCFYMLYNIGMMLVSFFEQITSLQDTFDTLYVPKHVYRGKHGGGN